MMIKVKKKIKTKYKTDKYTPKQFVRPLLPKANKVTIQKIIAIDLLCKIPHETVNSI